MRTTAITAAACAIIAAANARITGFYIPSVVGTGDDIPIKIIAENYIQSEQDVAMSFGIADQSDFRKDSLGTLMNSTFLGRKESNIVGNISRTITVPSGLTHNIYSVTGTLFFLSGALLAPTQQSFVANITVVNPGTLSPDWVHSEFE